MTKLTNADVEANIIHEYYFNGASAIGLATKQPHEVAQMITFCVLILSNGTPVTGESICPDANIFNEITGRRVARQNAIKKVWPLMLYANKL
jgi:hypothetical protein